MFGVIALSPCWCVSLFNMPGNAYKKITYKGERKKEHRIKIEILLNRKLKSWNQIHHRDGNGFNNSNDNLIVCENSAYHKLIERREKAYRITGDPTKRRCWFCKQWDNINNMRAYNLIKRYVPDYEHIKCSNDYKKAYRLIVRK